MTGVDGDYADAEPMPLELEQALAELAKLRTELAAGLARATAAEAERVAALAADPLHLIAELTEGDRLRAALAPTEADIEVMAQAAFGGTVYMDELSENDRRIIVRLMTTVFRARAGLP